MPISPKAATPGAETKIGDAAITEKAWTQGDLLEGHSRGHPPF